MDAALRLRNPPRLRMISALAKSCARRRSTSCGSPTALGTLAGLMVISQLVPFAKSAGIPGAALITMSLVVGAVGNASGRILSGWMSDAIGRLNVLRLMIGISDGGHAPALPGGRQRRPAVRHGVHRVLVLRHAIVGRMAPPLPTSGEPRTPASTTVCCSPPGDVAGISGAKLGGMMYDKYHNYQMAFYTAANSGGGCAGLRTFGQTPPGTSACVRSWPDR